MGNSNNGYKEQQNVLNMKHRMKEQAKDADILQGRYGEETLPHGREFD
jgi:hypothetical protein